MNRLLTKNQRNALQITKQQDRENKHKYAMAQSKKRLEILNRITQKREKQQEELKKQKEELKKQQEEQTKIRELASKKIQGAATNNDIQNEFNNFKLNNIEELIKKLNIFKKSFLDLINKGVCVNKTKRDIIKSGFEILISRYDLICKEFNNYGLTNPYDSVSPKIDIEHIKTDIGFVNLVTDDENYSNFCNIIALLMKLVDLLSEKLTTYNNDRNKDINILYFEDINNYIKYIHNILLNYLKNEVEFLEFHNLIKNLKNWIDKCNDDVDSRYNKNNDKQNNAKNTIRNTKITEFSKYKDNYISIMDYILKLDKSKDLILPNTNIIKLKKDLGNQISLYNDFIAKSMKNTTPMVNNTTRMANNTTRMVNNTTRMVNNTTPMVNNSNKSTPSTHYNICIFVSWLLDNCIILQKFIKNNILFDERNFVYLYNIKILFEYINDNLSKYQKDKNYERYNNKMKNIRRMKFNSKKYNFINNKKNGPPKNHGLQNAIHGNHGQPANHGLQNANPGNHGQPANHDLQNASHGNHGPPKNHGLQNASPANLQNIDNNYRENIKKIPDLITRYRTKIKGEKTDEEIETFFTEQYNKIKYDELKKFVNQYTIINNTKKSRNWNKTNSYNKLNNSSNNKHKLTKKQIDEAIRLLNTQ
jgi:hypothetical protein